MKSHPTIEPPPMPVRTDAECIAAVGHPAEGCRVPDIRRLALHEYAGFL